MSKALRNKTRLNATAVSVTEYGARGDGVTDDAAAIQQALDQGGTVTILQPGTYRISGTLVIGSNTNLIVGEGVTIKAVNSNDKPLLKTRAWVAMQSSPESVTLTWTSGMTFSVTWTSHQFAKGDAVWIDGATLEPQFKGVFSVESVTDANTFVVRAKRLPLSGPTGSVQAVAATQNVLIEGGTWDFNYDGSFPTSELDRHGFMFIGVSNLWERDTKVINCPKFSRYWSASLNCGFDNIGSPYNVSDLVKLYGPAYGFRGRGLWGTCGDDVVSMHTREPPIYVNYQPYYGDVIDCLVEDISATSTTSLAVFYSRRIADGVMDKCWYRNVGGTAANGVRLLSSSSIVPETVERSVLEVGVDGVRIDGTYAVKSDICMGESLKLFNINPCVNQTGPSSHVLLVANADFRTIEMRGLLVAAPSWTGAGGAFIQSTATCDLMTIRDATCKVSGSVNPRLLQLQAAAQTRCVEIIGVNTDADALVDTYATNTPTITVSSSRLGGAAVISVRASCNLNFTGGNDITNASNGVVRYNATATVTLRTDGTNRLRAGSWVAAPTGTPTLNVYGWDVNIDPITVPGASSTQGQFCWSTQAGAEGGPAVRGPSAWYALAAGTAGANNQIT